MLPTERFSLIQPPNMNAHKQVHIHSSMQQTFRYPHRVWLHCILQVDIPTSIDIYTGHIQPAHVHAYTHTPIHTPTDAHTLTVTGLSVPEPKPLLPEALWPDVTTQMETWTNKSSFIYHVVVVVVLMCFFKPRTLVILLDIFFIFNKFTSWGKTKHLWSLCTLYLLAYII